MTLPPAASAISIMRPSTWSGTPEIICFGGVPSRSGQLRRTSSWLAPMPPEVTSTTGASSANSPTAVRELRSPRRTPLGSSTSPRTPVDRAAGDHELVDLVAEAQLDQPARGCASRTRRSNGSSTPGPVPQVRWKRGTELPWPVAR